jgi:hypothetical protein
MTAVVAMSLAGECWRRRVPTWTVSEAVACGSEPSSVVGPPTRRRCRRRGAAVRRCWTAARAAGHVLVDQVLVAFQDVPDKLAVSALKTCRLAGKTGNGQTQIRTRDTTIFGRTESDPENCLFAGHLHLPTPNQVPLISDDFRGFGPRMGVVVQNLAAPVGNSPIKIYGWTRGVIQALSRSSKPLTRQGGRRGIYPDHARMRWRQKRALSGLTCLRRRRCIWG